MASSIVLGIGFLYIFSIVVIAVYQYYQLGKYGPTKNIEFERYRFKILTFLIPTKDAVSKEQIRASLNIEKVSFKQVLNSLERDGLIFIFPTHIMLTTHGVDYYDNFIIILNERLRNKVLT